MSEPTGLQLKEVVVHAGPVELEGQLIVPEGAGGLVIFAHGSGSSRFSRRNQAVAQTLNQAGLATLLFDLLTAEENQRDQLTAELRFDIPLLAERVVGTLDWAVSREECADLPVGLFGASTGAAAALVAAAERPELARAVVSRGGRPDLAGESLPHVEAPTLLIVGGRDVPVIALNEKAGQQLRVEHRLEIVPGATHLFEEPGALERVARLASQWFRQYLMAWPRAI